MILNVVLNLILIPLYGIIGSAVATLVSYSVVAFVPSFHSEYRFQLKMMLRSLFLISLVGYLKNRHSNKRNI
jgi:O-antigen/teichoic acid export membrane protein